MLLFVAFSFALAPPSPYAAVQYIRSVDSYVPNYLFDTQKHAKATRVSIVGRERLHENAIVVCGKLMIIFSKKNFLEKINNNNNNMLFIISYYYYAKYY